MLWIMAPGLGEDAAVMGLVMVTLGDATAVIGLPCGNENVF